MAYSTMGHSSDLRDFYQALVKVGFYYEVKSDWLLVELAIS